MYARYIHKYPDAHRPRYTEARTNDQFYRLARTPSVPPLPPRRPSCSSGLWTLETERTGLEARVVPPVSEGRPADQHWPVFWNVGMQQWNTDFSALPDPPPSYLHLQDSQRTPSQNKSCIHPWPEGLQLLPVYCSIYYHAPPNVVAPMAHLIR